MNVHVVTRAAEGLPRRRFSVTEVEAMVQAGIVEEDERIELIGGELVPMSPKGNNHELVKSALVDQWNRFRPPSVRITSATTFRCSDDTFLEPDVVVYPRESGLVAISSSNVLLMVEIADSSRRFDLGRKAAIYASFGVREVWVIDAVRLTTRTFHAPSERGYGEKRDFRAAERIVPLFAPAEFSLRLDELELI
jgi:Uma2 family endonuclease